jgi:cysteine desulfurase
MIEASAIAKALKPHTGFVSVQAVNNETGTIQPLAEISEVLARRGILFHTDAAQALGKMPFSVVHSGVDFASFSAHKGHGPQGIGALYVKSSKSTMLKPLHHGGGQEGGLRSGTLPTALCAGFGEACRVIEDDRMRTQIMRRDFLDRITVLKPIVHGHADPEWNVPGILNLRFPGIDHETLVMGLPGLAFGTGSACNSGKTKVSHVIQAMTGSEEAANESIRLSFGRMTSSEDLQQAADQIIAAVDAPLAAFDGYSAA